MAAQRRDWTGVGYGISADEANTMNELDTVVLTKSMPALGLEAGDVGAIVHRHSPEAFEVEFVTGEGGTVAVATLNASDLRRIGAEDILHVRRLAHR
jgi:hypothetical protein